MSISINIINEIIVINKLIQLIIVNGALLRLFCPEKSPKFDMLGG